MPASHPHAYLYPGSHRAAMIDEPAPLVYQPYPPGLGSTQTPHLIPVDVLRPSCLREFGLACA